MGTPIKEVLKWVHKEKDLEGIPFAVEDISEGISRLIINERPHKETSRIGRLLPYKSEETLKTIIEKLFASSDKRLINMNAETREIEGMISMSNIFVYATS
jgi:predicted Ser/Thr protein kinase